MREKTGGRQKGTPNKISSQIKEKLSLLIDETIDRIDISKVVFWHLFDSFA